MLPVDLLKVEKPLEADIDIKLPPVPLANRLPLKVYVAPLENVYVLPGESVKLLNVDVL